MDGEWPIWAMVVLAGLGSVAILQYILVVLFERRRLQAQGGRRLPSPPQRLPVLGHLHHFLASKQLLHKWLHDVSKRYGPIVSLQMGSVPMLVVSSPDMARAVLNTHDLVFASRSTTNSAARLFSYNHAGLAHTPYGAYWRKVKELYMTKIFNAGRLQHFKPIRRSEALGLVGSVWGDHHAGSDAQDMHAKLQLRACNVISRMALGKSFDELSAITNTSGSALFGAVCESLQLIGTSDIGDLVPALRFLDIQRLRKRSEDTFRKLHSVFQSIIDERRRRSRSGAHREEENDLLDSLLQLLSVDEFSPRQLGFREESIKAILWDMFAGGIDTSTVVVEWALTELLRHDKSMRKLQEELDLVVGNGRLMGEEDIANLPYLQAVVKETMRVHPVVPLLIPHESTEPCEVAGFYVAEKTRLIVNTWSLSMDESSWDNPSEFRPQRFLGSNEDLRGHHFQLLPFGSGRRACPAINLGLINVYLMLGSLVQCFEWTLPPGVKELDMSETFGIVLHKSNPLVLKASPRLPTEFYVSLVNQ